jgi:S-adenosyl-L-methionine hydrolase (adenosine-forming)
MRPPIVALLTDFGTSDGYVGAMKGVILSCAPRSQVVDITHEIPPQDIRSGARALKEAAPMFPPGTIFVAVVDPGVGTSRKPILVRSSEADGDGAHLFIGPDNGLLSLATGEGSEGWILDNTSLHRDEVSATFHGRDIFAAVAGKLASGTEPSSCGTALQSWAELPRPETRLEGKTLIGRVVHVDRFGNLITNVPAERLRGGAWEVALAGQVLGPVRKTFGDVEPGGWVAYLGSGGELEIAIRNGRASDLVKIHQAQVKVTPCER